MLGSIFILLLFDSLRILQIQTQNIYIMANTKIRSKFIQTSFFLLSLIYNYSSIAQLRAEVYDTDFNEVSDDTFSNKKGHWIIDKTKNTLVLW
jgi:hypothetical protein